MANIDRLTLRSTASAALLQAKADPLATGVLIFIAAAFMVPTGAAYALVFYLAVIPAWLASLRGNTLPVRSLGFAVPLALIAFSSATLLWGHDDGHRVWRFAAESLWTAIFVCSLLTVLREEATRRRVGSLLIWAATANAAWSLLLAAVLPKQGDRMHGWGVTNHPILGATVIATALLCALSRAVSEPEWRLRHVAACAVMAIFILFTESRGPLGAMCVASLFICAAGPWRARAGAALAGVALAWWLLPASFRAHEAETLANRGTSHRFEIWHRTLQMIAERPIFGHGLAANLDHAGATFPHDLFLSVLFYSGAAGFVLFAVLLAFVASRLWRARPAQWSGDPSVADWVWMVALWINALVSGLTDLGQITKGPGPLWLIFWLPVCLALSVRRPAHVPGWAERPSARMVSPPATA